MPKILITDDSEFMREILSNILVKNGYRDIIEASNGEEAIETYRRENPDLVLLDIIMGPSLTGLDALKDIKKIDPSAKVIMITVVDQPEVGKRAKTLGALDYIYKPVDKKIFLKVIKNALKA
jgi:two-component system, chemotaxis family, chemotaxis protein CheY